MQHNITPVILAGGQGLRLRPFTSSNRPKPFLRMGRRHSFFQKTVLRVKEFNPPVIVCHADYADLVSAHLDEIDVNPAVIILEPDHRGTAAAISLAALYLKDKDMQMLVMPSDHVMSDDGAFAGCVLEASRCGEQSIVTLGARPRKASTRFGYIRVKEGGRGGVFEVEGFVEKPNAAAAKKLLSESNCFWNTGVFICDVVVFLEQMRGLATPIYNGVEASYISGVMRSSFFEPEGEAFLALPSISIDYALMEKLSVARVVPIDCGWDDIGVLSSLLRQVIFFR